MQTALIENVAREDLNPVDEARACADAGRGARALEGGARRPPRPHPPGDLEPDPAARPARRRARAARGGRAQRGPRPGDPDREGQRRPPPPRPRRGRRRLVGARDRAPGEARRGDPEREGRRRTPIRRRRCSGPRTRSSGRSGTGVRVRAAPQGLRAELQLRRRSTSCSSSRAPARAADPRLGRQPLDPPAVAVAGVAEAVVQAADLALPELDRLAGAAGSRPSAPGRGTVAAVEPLRRPRRAARRAPSRDVERPRLRRGPGAELGVARAGGEVGVGVGGAEPLDRARGRGPGGRARASRRSAPPRRRASSCAAFADS